MALTYNIPLAGARFGLTQKELAERYGLTDDQAEGIYTEFGETQPMKMTETTYKGRGTGTLGYQVGGLPTRTETIFENFAPAYKPLEAGETTKETPKETPEKVLPEVPTEKADRLLSSFIGEMADPASKGKSIGAMGVGRAMEYGYTKPEILAKAEQEGLTFGEQAARGLDLPYVSDLTGIRGAEADPNYPRGLGLEGVQNLENLGYSKQAIQGIAAQQGIKFGEKASAYLGGAPRVDVAPARAASPAPAATIESIGKREAQPQYQQMTGSIGKAGLERAAAQLGISPQEAARRAQAQGTTLGPAAMALLG